MRKEVRRITNLLEKPDFNEFHQSQVFWGVIPYQPNLAMSYLNAWRRREYPEILVPHSSNEQLAYQAQVLGFTCQDKSKTSEDIPTMKLLLKPTKVVNISKRKIKITSSPAGPRVTPELP
jgi:hypothetical protein